MDERYDYGSAVLETFSGRPVVFEPFLSSSCLANGHVAFSTRSQVV
jgi:hypothetical protein